MNTNAVSEITQLFTMHYTCRTGLSGLFDALADELKVPFEHKACVL